MRIISCAINDTSPSPGVEEARLMDSREVIAGHIALAILYFIHTYIRIYIHIYIYIYIIYIYIFY